MTSRPLAFLFLAACRGSDGGERIVNDTDPPVQRPDTGPVATPACPGARDVDADGWDAPADGGTDCDDFDPGVSPAADDPVVDGVDADCDGFDGPPTTEACTPTGPEDCDGLDDDCDGYVDDPFPVIVDGTPTVVAAGPLLPGGEMAMVVGDTSVATEEGAVVLYDLDGDEVVRIEGAGQSPTFGQQIATGRDLTGDGVVDLVVAAPFATVDGEANQGRIFVFAGPIAPGTTLDDAVSVFVGGELDGQPGTALALAPDLTGDGRAELLVGYYRHVLLFSGVPPAEARVADAYATWERNTGGGAWTFATAPDVDGDGRDELVLGMSTANAGAGSVARWNSSRIRGTVGAEDFAWDPGEATGLGAALVRVGDELWTLAGTTPVRLGEPADTGGADLLNALPYTATGLANAGDLDGDGRDDLLVATEDAVVALSDGAELGRFSATATLQSDRALAAATDIDGDGVSDPRARTDTWAAVLDGATAFGGGCDADGDGVGTGQGDCDDGDPAIAPVYGREACNGLDDDCDGVVDGPAEVPLPARAEWVSGLGDMDGDRVGELALLDANGLVTTLEADATERARITEGRPGPYGVAGAGDVDGNAIVELLVAGDQATWILPPGVSGAASALAQTTITDGTTWSRDGRVGHAGDRDGDGLSDVWVGVRGIDGDLALALWHAPPNGTFTADDPDILLTAPEGWPSFEVAAARPGERADLDGDGLDDLLVGNPTAAYGAGRAYVFLATTLGAHTMDDDAAMLVYGEPAEQLGRALAIGGDLDGDGHDDALLGGAGGVRPVAGAGCPILLATRWDVPVAGLALTDLDGDGRAEAWLADPTAQSGRGAIWRTRWGDAPELLRVGTLGEALGDALWPLGDTDGEGGGDLAWRTATATARVGASCE